MVRNTLAVKLQLLGYAVEFVSTEHQLIETVSQCYPMADSNSQLCQIRIKLQSSRAKQNLNSIRFRLSNGMLVGKNGASFCFADRSTMSGHLRLCNQIQQNHYLLRHQFINAVCYFLLSYQFVTPLHCCAFTINSHTFVCLGQSGAGKSNLAMAAVKHGYELISEDLAFIGQNRLFADCREIHLLADSAKRFCELEQLKISLSHNGKSKYIVPVNTRTNVKPHERLSTIFIKPNFGSDQSKITEHQDPACFDSLFTPTEAGFNLHCKTRQDDIQWLSHQPSYLAQLGRSGRHFFDQLEALS